MAAAQYKSNNSVVISQLIQAGVSVNAVSQDEYKTTALQYACAFSTVETVRTLIDNGANVNVPNGHDCMPIHTAASEGKAATVTLLISKGADIHALGHCGLTTLMEGITSKINCVDIVKLLVKAGVNVNAVSGEVRKRIHDDGSFVQMIERASALHVACLLNRLDCVKFLLDHGADTNITNGLGDRPLHMAVYGESLKICKILIQRGATIDSPGADGVTSLCLAAMEESSDMVRFLLENKADANIGDHDGQLPLHKAARNRKPFVTRILMLKTTDINSKDDTGCTALHLASKGFQDNVTLLLQIGCKVNIQNDLGNTAVHIAAQAGHNEILKLLHQFKAHLDTKNYSGETATFTSCSRLNLMMVELLVNSGCDPLTTDNIGSSLLHAVIQSEFHAMLLSIVFEPSKADEQAYKHLGISKMSLLRVENTEHTDFSFVYNTSMGKAQRLIESNRYDKLTCLQPLFVTIIDRLLSLGLDINATDYNQQTPLHLAAASGFLTAVVYLVEKGASIMARDKFGFIPLFLSMDNSKVFTYLLKRSEGDLVEDDYKQIARLAHFHDLSKVLRKCQHKFSEKLSLEVFPQKVKPQWVKLASNEDLKRKMPIWLTTLQPLTYVNHDDMIHTVTQLLQDLENYMKEEDEQLAFEAQRCGSEEEGTKVMSRDEQDVPCILTNVRFDMFEEPTRPDPDLNAFVELVCKREYRRFMRRLLDKKQRLSPSKLCKYFYRAVSKFLARPETLRKYPQIQRIMVKDVTERNRRIACLHIRWHDDVYPLLDIGIDLVPMIALPGWWPHWGNRHPLAKHLECVALPKWKLTQEIEMTVMEIGVHRWGPLFRMMPNEMKEGYRLAKVVRDKGVCPIIEDWQPASYFMDSYFMKQIIIKEYVKCFQPVPSAIPEDQEGLDDNVTPENAQVSSTNSSLFWARQIYEELEKAFDEGHLTTFLFPDYNLLKDTHFRQYKGRACHYARLCRELLTPQSVQHFKKAYMGLSTNSIMEMQTA